MKRLLLVATIFFSMNSFADAVCEKMIQDELTLLSEGSHQIKELTLNESKHLSPSLKVFEVSSRPSQNSDLGFRGIATWYAVVRVSPTFTGDSRWACEKVEAMVFGSQAI